MKKQGKNLVLAGVFLLALATMALPLAGCKNEPEEGVRALSVEDMTPEDWLKQLADSTGIEYTIEGTVCTITADNQFASNDLLEIHITLGYLQDFKVVLDLSKAEELDFIGGEYPVYNNVLTSVILPSSVISIGHHAFCDCTGLTEVTIPANVTEIGMGAFGGCNNLTNVIFNEQYGWYKENPDGVLDTTSINVSDSSANAANLKKDWVSMKLIRRP